VSPCQVAQLVRKFVNHQEQFDATNPLPSRIKDRTENVAHAINISG